MTLSELRPALEAYRAAARATDVAMQRAEAQSDATAMRALAMREQASRDAFFVSDGLLQNSYYHTIDRVFTSFPEIAFAGGNPDTVKKALARALDAIARATAALTV
jgi:hypothetical protein